MVGSMSIILSGIFLRSILFIMTSVPHSTYFKCLQTNVSPSILCMTGKGPYFKSHHSWSFASQVCWNLTLLPDSVTRLSFTQHDACLNLHYFLCSGSLIHRHLFQFYFLQQFKLVPMWGTPIDNSWNTFHWFLKNLYHLTLNITSLRNVLEYYVKRFSPPLPILI